MLHCIFNEWLYGKRRQQERCRPDIVFDVKPFVKPELFQTKIDFHMLKLLAESDRNAASDCLEIPPEIVGKVTYGLPGSLYISVAQMIYRIETVIQKMRLYLAYHDCYPVFRNLFFLL